MSKSIISGIISSLVFLGIDIVFFVTNAPVRQFLTDHMGEAVVSYALVVLLTGLIAWAVCEAAWRKATTKLRKKLDETTKERDAIKWENEELKEAYEECRITAAGKSAQKMIGSWGNTSK